MPGDFVDTSGTVIIPAQPPDENTHKSPLFGPHGGHLPSPKEASSYSKFMGKYGPAIGRVITIAQLASASMMIVDACRKNLTIKSQNISMTEFGHETGQRFDQYN